MKKSQLLCHRQCPECSKVGRDKSKDNLAVYKDGSTYCFSCGYKTFSKVSIDYLKEKIKSVNTPAIVTKDPLDLNNYTKDLPVEARQYLASKYINQALADDANILWDGAEQRLVYPVLDEEGNVVFLCKRTINATYKENRYKNHGEYKNHMMLVGDPNNSIIFVVEDYLSAIRIAECTDTKGKHFCAAPLFGSNLTEEQAFYLDNNFFGMVLFLDSDKYMKAAELKRKYHYLFEDISLCHAYKDPKDYDHEGLEKVIRAQHDVSMSRIFQKEMERKNQE